MIKITPFNGVMMGLVVTILFVITGVQFFYRSKQTMAMTITSDLSTLKDIIEKIDRTCRIISFDYFKNPINFLTIKKGGFLGSEVGSMNLTHPENWEGPYVLDNLTIQGIEYQILHTNYGYFILPGDGVRLPNDKIIGKDIVLTEETDVRRLMNTEEGFMYGPYTCAVPLNLQINTFKVPLMPEDEL
ncbi:MAG: hypothetical protein WBQ73_00385 [Candidatus Babeliales bacterium]